MRAYLAIVLSIALVAVVGCGGKGHASTAANSTHPLVGGPVIQQLPALPPASPFVAQRIASTAQLQLAGTDTFAVSPAGAFVQGNAMRLQ